MELRIETTLASKTDRQEIEKVIRLANALIA